MSESRAPPHDFGAARDAMDRTHLALLESHGFNHLAYAVCLMYDRHVIHSRIRMYIHMCICTCITVYVYACRYACSYVCMSCMSYVSCMCMYTSTSRGPMKLLVRKGTADFAQELVASGWCTCLGNSTGARFRPCKFLPP